VYIQFITMPRKNKGGTISLSELLRKREQIAPRVVQSIRQAPPKVHIQQKATAPPAPHPGNAPVMARMPLPPPLHKPPVLIQAPKASFKPKHISSPVQPRPKIAIEVKPERVIREVHPIFGVRMPDHFRRALSREQLKREVMGEIARKELLKEEATKKKKEEARLKSLERKINKIKKKSSKKKKKPNKKTSKKKKKPNKKTSKKKKKPNKKTSKKKRKS
jgi:hypothetical protein